MSLPRPNVQIVLGSTRAGRRGENVARWLFDVARRRADFTVELVDLRDWPMPLFDQSKTPAMGEYTAEYQTRWARKIAAGDGFVFVTGEYNHGPTAVLKNALDAIWSEWNHKPVAFASYGDLAGGSRAVEQLRQIAVELEMVAIRVQVLIPQIDKAFDADGKPAKAESLEKFANKMFDQLTWWAVALKHAREHVPYPEWMKPAVHP